MVLLRSITILFQRNIASSIWLICTIGILSTRGSHQGLLTLEERRRKIRGIISMSNLVIQSQTQMFFLKKIRSTLLGFCLVKTNCFLILLNSWNPRGKRSKDPLTTTIMGLGISHQDRDQGQGLKVIRLTLTFWQQGKLKRVMFRVMKRQTMIFLRKKRHKRVRFPAIVKLTLTFWIKERLKRVMFLVMRRQAMILWTKERHMRARFQVMTSIKLQSTIIWTICFHSRSKIRDTSST